MQIPNAKLETFLSTDEKAGLMRYAWLDTENRRLLATDGHKALRVNVLCAEEDTPGLIPREVFDLARKELKAIVKQNGKDQLPDVWLRVLCHEEAVEIENLLTNTKHLVVRPKPLDQKFPNIDTVFPNKSVALTTAVNKSLIADIAGSLDGGIDLNLFVTAVDGVIVLASSSGAASVVLMPVRSELQLSEVLTRGNVKNPDKGKAAKA